MGIVSKKCLFPVKYRIIHDLSWPPQDSVNDHIDPDAFRCFYGSYDDVVALIIKHGLGALSAKLDLADAFKHNLVRSQDWLLMCSSSDLQWPDRSTVCLCYIDLFLPFGLHSSPALFNKYTDALQYAMQTNNVQDLLHYPDDYFTVGPPDSSACTNNITIMIATCEELGFAVKLQKVTTPATTANFLGADIDSVTMQARIDPSCLSWTISLHKDILGHWFTTKQTILSLIGKLHFVHWVCRPGRAFLTTWSKHPWKLSTSTTGSSWMRNFGGMLHGGCNICLPGMGSAFYMSPIGSSEWSVDFSQMPVM